MRLFLIAWIVYSVHFATNIVREHYPAFALIETGTFQVDRYVGFHADIFEHTDGHAYVCNNVAGSVVAALPLLVFEPLLDRLEAYSRARLEADPDPVDVTYDTKYPNRRDMFRRVRQAGLDLRFGAAAAITSVFLMAPLCAFMVVLMHRLLRARGIGRESALHLAVLFAFGTPLFYRAAHLNHNVMLMAVLFGAYLLLWARPEEQEPVSSTRRAWAGFLCGCAVALDYAGALPAAVLAAYLWVPRARATGWGRSSREALPFALASLPPIAFLMWSQWIQFGNPLRPAQFYMPAVNFTDQGVQGLTWPRWETFLENLISPSWGLLWFAPVLVLGFVPAWRYRASELLVPRRERRWIALFTLAFLLFCAANQYALMQFNTGFRYLMVLVPFLFLTAADHLLRLPRRVLWVLTVLAIAHTWILSMTREVNDTEKDLRDLAIERGVSRFELPGYWRALATETPVPMSYRRIVHEGPQLPWLTVLAATPLGRGTLLASPLAPIAVLALMGLLLWAVWALGARGARAPTIGPAPRGREAHGRRHRGLPGALPQGHGRERVRVQGDAGGEEPGGRGAQRDLARQGQGAGEGDDAGDADPAGRRSS